MERVTFFPGTRVRVFDPRLYVDDVKTPISHTMRPATVVRWYGYTSKNFGRYPELIDVRFDHRPDTISRGHFTEFLRPEALASVRVDA